MQGGGDEAGGTTSSERESERVASVAEARSVIRQVGIHIHREL